MKLKISRSSIGWTLVYIVILVNIVTLFLAKKSSVSGEPFPWLELEKPTLLVVLDEFECASCVHNLQILNALYETLRSDGQIDVRCLIMSRSKSDSKNISSFFAFPVTITDDFKIFRRLNIRRTPLILGISSQKNIVYSELIPSSTMVTEEYLRHGVLDRLYYSLML